MLNDKHIKEINFPSGLKWISVDKASKKQTSWLKEKYNFSDLDLKDIMPPLQRPKMIEYDDYLFIILQFPVYNRSNGEIDSSEIDFFIGKNYLITIHDGRLDPLNELFLEHSKKTKKNHDQFDTNPGALLYELLNSLLHYCFPMLNHINQDIDAIEKGIFDIDHGTNVNTIREIMRIKSNIVNFRKTMQAHKSIIQKLISHSEKLFTTHKLEVYYGNLVNHTKDIWEFLSNYKDTIDALHEAHESLVSHRLNQIMKTLTVFSVIVFPLTLFAAIFGMNTMNAMPFVDSPYDFWYIMGIMLFGVIAMILFFKTRKWM